MIGLVVLTMAVVCVMGYLYCSMPQAFPYAHMETIPIDLNGWALPRHFDKTEVEAMQEGCEATVISKWMTLCCLVLCLLPVP